LTMDAVLVTTSRRPGEAETKRAVRYAKALHTHYLEREAAPSWSELWRCGESLLGRPPKGFVVVGKGQLFIQTPIGPLHYHPGMALHRVAALRRGEADIMTTTVMHLEPGDRVLDCTAGLGADAVTAAYAVGPAGRVTALERIGALALLLKVGLKTYGGDNRALISAMRRVRVRHASYQDYLARCRPGEYDIVYFDPMFTKPVAGSSGIAPLRTVADHSQLTGDVLQMAGQIARRAVVVKDRYGGYYMTKWTWDEIIGGRHSRIVYCLRRAADTGH